MENHSTDSLSMRPGHTKERRNPTGGRSKYRDRSKSPRNSLKSYVGNVVSLGFLRIIVDQKV